MKQTKKVREIKDGDFFKLTENGKVYIRGEYDREKKKYAKRTVTLLNANLPQ